MYHSVAFAQHQKHCKPERLFKQTHVKFFLPQKYDAISQLRYRYAKGPFYVKRLM